MAALFALSAAVSFGVADFAGGLAARRTSALTVTLLVQLAGSAVLLPALALLPGHLSTAAAVSGAIAGLAGSFGLLLYLRGLAVGPMGVVAPLSALIGAGLPFGVGVLTGERPPPVTLGGVVAALLAVALATANTRRGGAPATGLLLGLGSGVGFGLFYVALGTTPPGSGLWPLLAARGASLVLFGGLVLSAARARSRPAGLGLIALSGALDMIANILFLLAVRSGALGVSAVLVSLYPVVVVVLARFVLGERLNAVQLASVTLAVAAGAVLSAGG
ncbi:MAG: EamA/RhaT family transporter [Actinomycetota bacterium]|nr:EamA/RhaT family transporter [Actinomycetota bacterium]